MRSVFAKKTKMKTKNRNETLPKSDQEPDSTNPESLVSSSERDGHINRCMLKKPQIPKTSSNQTNLSSSLTVARKPRASSSSPKPDLNGRRGFGASVTFESTLPTQIWQASPSPSPPMGDSTRKSHMNRMSSSLSNEWDIQTAKQKNNKRYSGHSTSKTTEPTDSSDEINPTSLNYPSLSSCTTSSDETTTSQERSSRYNHKHPHHHHHHHHHHNHQQRRSDRGDQSDGSSSSCSTSITSSTDSTSSLDIHIVPKSGHLQTSKPGVKQHQNHRSDRRHGKQTGDKKRRNQTAEVLGSSSSTSSDDDLEEFGWDAKSISALTNRNRFPAQNSIVSPVKALKTNGKVTQQSIASMSPKVKNANSTLPWKPGSKMIPSQLSSPVKTVNKFHIDTPMHQPHTCVLTRRANNQLCYPDRLSSTSAVLENSIRPSFQNPTPFNSELLATVVSDFRPSSEWKERYKLLGVRQGDYVSVLSQSITNSQFEENQSNQSVDIENLIASNGLPSGTNAWLYVRRWCMDHLVATGSPGYVPRQNCRLLSSCEIMRLWRTSLKNRTTLEQQQKHRSHQNSQPHSQIPRVEMLAGIEPQPSDFNSTKALLLPSSNSNNISVSQLRRNDQPTSHTLYASTISAPCPVRFPVIFSRDVKDLDSTHSLQSLGPTKNPHCLPPPPPGFGSGGSIGSEAEDKDSGRGPSSGSEWGSGRGGSSNVTLDRSVVEQASSETGFECRPLQSEARSRNTKSAEESQLGWYAPSGSLWSYERSSNRDDELYSHDSALQSPNFDDLTPPLQSKDKCHASTDDQCPSLDRTCFTSPPVTLTTRTGNTPVLEMRPNGTPTLYARGISASTLNGSDSLATSTTTCATVIETKEDLNRELSNLTSNNLPHCRVPTPDPSGWEPYKTVIHVNENSLEKFTLV